MHEGGAQKMAAAAAGQTAASGQTTHIEPTEGLLKGKRTAAAVGTAAPGLEFPRFFSTAGVDPFDQVEWEVRDAVIGGDKGQVVFEQRQVEIPKPWSQQATNIV